MLYFILFFFVKEEGMVIIERINIVCMGNFKLLGWIWDLLKIKEICFKEVYFLYVIKKILGDFLREWVS